MSPRRVRVKRLVGVREKELDTRVTQLAESRREVERARQEQELEAQRAREAEAARAALASQAMPVSAWLDATDAWLHRQAQERAAALAALRARETETRAHSALMVARSALKRLEVLDQRLAVTERADEERRERRDEDERAALQSGRDARRER